MRLSDYHYPYTVLISKFLLYFEVNLEVESSELVKSSELGFTKIGGKWISKDGDLGASPSAAADLDEEEHAADVEFQHEDQPEINQDVGPSVGNQEDGLPTMSSFERYTVNRLDGFAENQRNVHDLCVSNFHSIDNRFNNMDSRFMTLDEQIEAVHNQIFDLQYAKDD